MNRFLQIHRGTQAISTASKHGKKPKLKIPHSTQLTDNTLTFGSKPHNHPADGAAPKQLEILSSLKK